MYPRDVNATTRHEGNTRRAFRDVTNSKQILNDNKKQTGIEKRSNVNNHRQKQIQQPAETYSAPVSKNDIQQPAYPGAYPLQRQQSSFNDGITRRNEGHKPSYQLCGPVDDIDARDSDDPLCATDYVHDMYKHFRLKEQTTSVRPIFMEHQTHINERMRSILIDWLVEVHLKFKLVPETLYLTVNIIDRYLERTVVSRPKLQLVGVTALLIGSKYEEIYPPELRDLVYICDHAYRKEEILEMEEVVLKTLEYQITIPSAHAFLVRYLKAAHADRKIVQLSCYILDGTLQSYSLLHYLPSQLAAAAVLIARTVVGRNPWSPTLLTYAHYCEEEVIPVARAVLAAKSSAAPELRAVNKKYSSSRYGGVASMTIECDF